MFRFTASVAAATLMFCGTAVAQTTVKWLHIEQNPAQKRKSGKKAARAYEAKTPGVKIEMQFLENEYHKGEAADHPALPYGFVLRRKADSPPTRRHKGLWG